MWPYSKFKNGTLKTKWSMIAWIIITLLTSSYYRIVNISGMTYIDSLDAACLGPRYSNDTNCCDAEEIEGGRADDGSRSQVAR